MTEKNKERTMKTLEDSFELKEVISNQELIRTFHKIFHPAMISTNDIFNETLYRTGASHEPTDFEIDIYAMPSRKEICKVHLPDFSRAALIEAQKYRITHNHEVEGIYRIVDKIEKEGTYIVTNNNSPRFRIDIDPSRFIASQLTIKECKGDGLFRYLPSLEKPPQTATIKTSVALKAKGNRETLTKKLFLDFHNEIKEQYQSKGATALNE